MGKDKLKQLAKALAINHFNVSISEKNIEHPRSKIPESIHTIFNNNLLEIDPKTKKTTLEKEEFCFTRNILIIGAGATTNTYEFIKTANGVIEEVQSNLGLRKLLDVDGENKSGNKLWEKYLQLARNLISNKGGFDRKSNRSFDELNKNLSFEDKQKLLLHFFTKEDVSAEIIDCLGYDINKGTPFKYLPSLFYELVAHLFKHRYIDIIINLNFDELLDNAIEDELGKSTYHKVSGETKNKKLSRIIDYNRLREPIYIKPHGTLSRRNSLRYTNEQYISLPNDFNELLEDIFLGKVGEGNESISRFNIILAGYSAGDIDIKSILYNQLNRLGDKIGDKKLKSINYYIFDRNPTLVRKTFEQGFKEFLKGERVKQGVQRIEEEISNKYTINEFRCGNNNNISEYDDKDCLGNQFLNLYEEIRSYFNFPFKPKYPTRHVILSLLFPKHAFLPEDEDGNIKSSLILRNPVEYFKLRERCLALYEVIKYKGHIPKNVLSSDRVGKYHHKHIEALRKNGVDKILSEVNPISFIRETFQESSIVTRSNSYITIKEFDEIKLDDKELMPEFIGRIVRMMVNSNSLIKGHNTKENLVEKIIKVLNIDNILNTRMNEINAVYDDSKKHEFNPFKSNFIINTNLELTWRFFSFFKNKNLLAKWNYLWMIDDTGKALYNLEDYSDSTTNSYLKEVYKKDKKVFLLHNIEEPESYSRKMGRAVNPIEQVENILKTNFKHSHISDEIHLHRMVIFLNRIGKKNKLKPVFGIYFFQPSKRVRINPAYFVQLDSNADLNTKRNLRELFEIFQGLAPSSWSEVHKMAVDD